jgi:hypothetical protein
VTALAVALLGATPLGQAAQNVVLFARNAGKVNGIGASRTPRAGQLLPLGANRKFPKTVVPEGPQGAQGPRGEQGPPGPPATNLFAVVNPDGTIHKSSGVVAVQRMSLGTYQLTFSRSLDDCSVSVNVGGHRTGNDTWTEIQRGIGVVRTFGQVAEVRTITDNGFSGGFQERDFGFHTAVFC